MTIEKLVDRDGTEICEGDVVEFSVSYDNPQKPVYDEGTLMRDFVIFKDGHLLFFDPQYGGCAFARTHAPHCKIVGKMTEDQRNYCEGIEFIRMDWSQ